MKKFTETQYAVGNKRVWYHLLDEESGMGVMCKTRNYRRMRKVLNEELKKSS